MRTASRTLVAAACLGVAATMVSSSSYATTGGLQRPVSRSWQVATVRQFGSARNASGYTSVIALGENDAWVFGGSNPGGPSTPVAVHWNGADWKQYPLPSVARGFISDASAVSAHDIWAVSYYGGYALNWDGGKWRMARRWPGLLSGVTAITPDDVWVFGTDPGGTAGSGTWRYNGRSWRKVNGPASRIYRASAVSQRDIWAIASQVRDGRVSDQILHYGQRRWHVIRIPRALRGARLHDILARSAHDVWLAGNTSPPGQEKLLVAHLHGTRWSVVTRSRRVLAGQLSADGRGGVWLTLTPTNGSSRALIAHVRASGRMSWPRLWQRSGIGLTDVAVIPHDGGNAWATGGVLVRDGGLAVVFALGQGWAAAALPPSPLTRLRAQRAAQQDTEP